MKTTKKCTDLIERLTPIGYNNEGEACYDIDDFLNLLGISIEEAMVLLTNALQESEGKEEIH